MPFDHALDAQALDVLISELLVATADGCDPEIDKRIPGVLSELRQQLRMDLVFVSEFINGKRVFRFVEGDVGLGIQAGDASPLEDSYCHRVVQGRLPELVHDAEAVRLTLSLPDAPFRVGGHLSTPVQLSNGTLYGTLCCFSTQPNPQLRSADLSRLKACARLVARKIESAQEHHQQLRQQHQDFRDTEVDWSML